MLYYKLQNGWQKIVRKIIIKHSWINSNRISIILSNHEKLKKIVEFADFNGESKEKIFVYWRPV
jgi:hypothetical protein